MIFKNRELYDKYNTIEYNDIAFMVDMPDSEIEDDDVFEFVFFLNANNTVIEKQCETNDDLKISVPDAYYSKSSNGIRTDKNGTEMDKGLYTSITGTTEFEKAVSSNTSVIDAENAQLLVNIMPTTDDDKYKVSNNKNTTYELSYKMYSYEATTDNSGDEQRFIHTLKEDKKVNGLYRVTKQGGGEYFLEFDGKVPERSSDESISDDGNSHISPGSSGSGLGLLCFGVNNINSLSFNGTSEEFSNVSRVNPWVITAHNLNLQGGVQCSDGKVLITDEEQQYT